ncbi:MAG: lipopolysaccharide transport periplasmic protein LptA [Candidatus Eutrophobiaceae bacterium]
MKSRIAIAFLLLSLPSLVGALSTDQEKDIVIHADRAELDDSIKKAVYRGNVEVNQGSLHMTGEVMTVHFTEENEINRIIMQGTLATCRQLPDGSEIYDEAEAMRIEYYVSTNRMILSGDAKIEKADVYFSGQRIEYDTERSYVVAEGDTKTQKKASNANGGDKQDGRVEVIIRRGNEGESD